MPFEAHGRAVSLQSAYWKRDEDDWNANSFRNLEDDPALLVSQYTSAPNGSELHDSIAGMWSVEVPNATKPGRNGFQSSTLKIG